MVGITLNLNNFYNFFMPIDVIHPVFHSVKLSIVARHLLNMCAIASSNPVETILTVRSRSYLDRLISRHLYTDVVNFCRFLVGVSFECVSIFC